MAVKFLLCQKYCSTIAPRQIVKFHEHVAGVVTENVVEDASVVREENGWHNESERPTKE